MINRSGDFLQTKHLIQIRSYQPGLWLVYEDLSTTLLEFAAVMNCLELIVLTGSSGLAADRLFAFDAVARNAEQNAVK